MVNWWNIAMMFVGGSCILWGLLSTGGAFFTDNRREAGSLLLQGLAIGSVGVLVVSTVLGGSS